MSQFEFFPTTGIEPVAHSYRPLRGWSARDQEIFEWLDSQWESGTWEPTAIGAALESKFAMDPNDASSTLMRWIRTRGHA